MYVRMYLKLYLQRFYYKVAEVSPDNARTACNEEALTIKQRRI